MKKVRDKLKELDHKLYESLMRSHDIAWNEWLPALSAQQDSYNSFPHIRNLEIYLDTIVNEYEEKNHRSFFISPVEIYIILASILFHDIGKITDAENHSNESRYIISGNPNKDNKESKSNYEVWAALGIPSFELAHSIGRICEYHDLDKENDSQKIAKLKLSLSSIYIDGYGEVRQKSLASLLMLLDHLDSTHTRILPNYLRGISEIKIVGAFRRVITGVYADLQSQMIRTVLNEKLPNGIDENHIYKHTLTYCPISLAELEDDTIRLDDGTLKNKREIEFIITMLVVEILFKHFFTSSPSFETKKGKLEITLSLNDYDKRDFLNNSLEKFVFTESHETDSYNIDNEVKAFLAISHTQDNKDFKALSKILEAKENYKNSLSEWIKQIHSDFVDKLKEPLDRNESYLYIENFFNDTSKHKVVDIWDKLMIKGKFTIEQNDKKFPVGWSENILQNMILGNVATNTRALRLVQSELDALGIPIKAWLIDHKEHLYNLYGKETYEPIFNKKYLMEIVQCMWELNTQIFGMSHYTYENLTAIMREPDILKIKMAVRRVSILLASTKNAKYSILAGDINWRWILNETNPKSAPQDKEKMKDVLTKDFKKIIDDLEKVGDPNVYYEE